MEESFDPLSGAFTRVEATTTANKEISDRILLEAHNSYFTHGQNYLTIENSIKKEIYNMIRELPGHSDINEYDLKQILDEY